MSSVAVSKILEKVRAQAEANFKLGKEQEKIRKFELLKELEIQKANELCYEWKRVSWFKSDGWNPEIAAALKKVGYIITDFDREQLTN